MIGETEYPYMYARVSAKKAKLLERQDYEKLLKMEPNGIARYLEEGAYQEDIDDLGDRHEGISLVELALNRNLSRTFSHLYSISPQSLQEVIEIYLRKYDIVSLKRLLRWKSGGERGNIEDMLTPVGSLSFDQLEEMAEKDFEEVVSEIGFPESEVDYSSCVEGKEDLSEIERALDRCYYRELENLEQEVESIHFSRFVRAELEFENLRTALRLKKYGFSSNEIRDRLVSRNGSDLLNQVVEAEDLDGAIQAVRDSGRLPDIETDRLEDIEHALEVNRLEEALQMLHVEPLGTTSILGYIVAKMIEVKNLRMLIRAKETGIQNTETIRTNLVLPRR